MTDETIRHEFTLAAGPAAAFERFARIGTWWDPRYTADAETFADVVVEGRVGGRVTEVHSDGRRFDWGEVTAWEPGRRLAFTSTLAQTREHPSEISAEFAAVGEGTLVRFAHGGWHEGNRADRARFTDWPAILARYAAPATPRPSFPPPGSA